MDRSRRKQKKGTPAKNMPPPSTTSAEKPRTIEQVREKFGRTPISVEIALQFSAALQKTCCPHLKDEHCIYERLEGRLEKEGDYMCYNILRICEILRSKDPKRYKNTTPKTIAKEIMANFEKSEMIRELSIFDIGFITFRLNGQWMVKRIQKNLKDGIIAWAPIAHARRAIVDSPTPDIDAEMHADGVRSSYIRDTLVNMLEYSGVEVSGRMVNEQSMCVAKKYFPEEGRVIRKKGETQSLFHLKEEASHKGEPNNVHMDLAALWCGIYEQKADWIVYVTPVRQGDYVRKCFTAAECYYEDKIFAAHRDFNNEDKPTTTYLGYQTSCIEQGKLISMWKKFGGYYKQGCDLLFVEKGIASGYSAETVFECAIKYDYLKTHKNYVCPLLLEEEIFRYEGNTFVRLLKTRSQIWSALKNSPGTDMFKLNEALVGREREMGLHLLQFTEVIDEAFSTCMPHLLCEYLFKLSKNITSYIKEANPSRTKFLLCKAAAVVMEKGFDLLGITPESSKGLPSYMKQQSGKGMAIRDQYISLPVFSPQPFSRFELFSMFIEVHHEKFDRGNLFGSITLSDTCGLLSGGWSNFDENGCGHVAHFIHEFDNPVGIRDTHLFSLENPGSRHAVPFSDSITMGVLLYVTTKRKDACYQLSSCDHPIDLSKFWHGKQSTQRSCFYAKSYHGCVRISYILIKDAVDTSWRLAYKPTNGAPKLRGRIIACYDDDAGGVGRNAMAFDAVMFHIEPSTLKESENLNLRRSVLAVPSNGLLQIKATIQDVDSGEYIVDDTLKYNVKRGGSNIEWPMEGKNCFFKLTVDLTVEGKNCCKGETELAVC